MNETTLGEWLRDARSEKEISLRSVATKLEITPSYLSDIENDRRIPAEDVLLKLTKELNLDFDQAMALAGRFGEQTERYLKRQPEAVKLMRQVSAANLSAKALRAMSEDVIRRKAEEE